MKFGIGQSVRRKEDDRLVTGHGRYTDDINLPNQLYLHVLRSPHAHARIGRIDTAAAKAAPGVKAVYTFADIDADKIGLLPCMIPIQNRDNSAMVKTERPALANGLVRHVGDPVAAIVAETYAQARDAADLVDIDYDTLPAIVDTAGATAKGAPQVWPEVKSNLAFDWSFGDEARIEEAFAKAAHVTKLDLIQNRIVVNAMEPRAAIGHFAADGSLTFYSSTQGGFNHKAILAAMIFNIPQEKVRIVTPDVGGGFGMKSFLFPEQVLVCYASRKLGKPVKWTGDRSESFLSDTMGRDNVTTAELALDKDNRFLALRVNTIANMGAYLSNFAPIIPTMAPLGVLGGVYDFPLKSLRVEGVYTHTVPVDAYRGAGRPEVCYIIERLVERAARELRVNAAELRRKNFIRPDQFPYDNGVGQKYDSGEFARCMDDSMAMADWSGFESRRKEAASRGKLRGIGMSYYVEITPGNPQEIAKIDFEADDTVSVWVGTQSNGQGHDTTFAQIVAERLGLPFDRINIRYGDTDKLKQGGGTGGSRSLYMAGNAIALASDALIKRGKEIASHSLEAAAADIEFSEGGFRIAGTDRKIMLLDLARAIRDGSLKLPPELAEKGLNEESVFTRAAPTFPNGCHICEVEIDPDTGVCHVARYSVCDDFGKVVNPMIVNGQVHGGIVQGLGQALLENAVYDPESGQLLTGTFMDYAMPRADDMPSFNLKMNEIPCRTNALGVKGCGEAGTVGALAAVMNAIVDALAPLGVTHMDMPATPLKIWQAVQNHRRVAAE
jgi:carbon-monoxide dehydrogenase large subunit